MNSLRDAGDGPAREARRGGGCTTQRRRVAKGSGWPVGGTGPPGRRTRVSGPKWGSNLPATFVPPDVRRGSRDRSDRAGDRVACQHLSNVCRTGGVCGGRSVRGGAAREMRGDARACTPFGSPIKETVGRNRVGRHPVIGCFAWTKIDVHRSPSDRHVPCDTVYRIGSCKRISACLGGRVLVRPRQLRHRGMRSRGRLPRRSS